MKIVISRLDAAIRNPEFLSAVAACQVQVRQHFAPAWAIDAELEADLLGSVVTPDTASDGTIAYLYVANLAQDKEKVKNALGYHSSAGDGVPYGFVFTDIAQRIGEPWSVTLSHEVLELLADPDVNLLAIGPRPNGNRVRSFVLRPYEICDPVQADTYEIDGVSVSNFVLPRYFVEKDLGHPTNHLAASLDAEKFRLKPFGLRPGGYYSYVDPETWKQEQVHADAEATRRQEIKQDLQRLRRVTRHAFAGACHCPWWYPNCPC